MAIPDGWKTYTYGKAHISVPNNWVVVRNGDCSIRSAPGTLNLESSGVPSCPAPPGDANDVTLTSLPQGEHFSLRCSETINGLFASTGPCGGTSDTDGAISYVIPSLGVQAVGEGADDEDVTGPGQGAIVGRVLHTLRR